MAGDYEGALKAAGAKVICMEYFGSYQGDWFAAVEYKDKRFFLHAPYGSCSGCDNYEGTFRYSNADPVLLKEFGESYLEDEFTYDKALEIASKNIDWDDNAPTMVSWIKSHKDWFDNNTPDVCIKESAD